MTRRRVTLALSCLLALALAVGLSRGGDTSLIPTYAPERP